MQSVAVLVTVLGRKAILPTHINSHKKRSRSHLLFYHGKKCVVSKFALRLNVKVMSSLPLGDGFYLVKGSNGLLVAMGLSPIMGVCCKWLF